MTSHEVPRNGNSYLRVWVMVVVGVQLISVVMLLWASSDMVPAILSSTAVGSILVIFTFLILPFALGLAIWLWIRERKAGIIGLICTSVIALEVLYFGISAIWSSNS